MYDQPNIHDTVANDSVRDHGDKGKGEERADPVVGSNVRYDWEDKICRNSAAVLTMNPRAR